MSKYYAIKGYKEVKLPENGRILFVYSYKKTEKSKWVWCYGVKINEKRSLLLGDNLSKPPRNKLLGNEKKQKLKK